MQRATLAEKARVGARELRERCRGALEDVGGERAG